MADEVIAPISDAEQHQPAVLSTAEGGEDPNVLTKISDLERENYVLQEQLAEAQATAAAATSEVERFRNANSGLEKAAVDRSEGFLKINRERETLLVDKSTLQSENAKLKHSVQLLETQTTRLLSEKRSLIEDITALKEDVQKTQARIAKLHTEADEFNAEKAALARDKERWALDKQIYAKSKEWYLNELTEREKTVSTLRLQISQIELSFGNERAAFKNKIDELTLQSETAATNLTDTQNEIATLRERLDASLAENNRILDSTANDLRVKEQLADAYKTEVTSLKGELESVQFDVNLLRTAIAEKDSALEAVGAETRRVADEAASQLSERETQIANLKEDLEKANELLKFGNTGINNINFNEISPAAAAAAELLQNGTSLTSIYAKHCKVVAELNEAQNERRELEAYVEKLLSDLKLHSPAILQMRREAETILKENEILREQLREVQSEREELMARCASVDREFTFTRTELVYAQRENDKLQKQVQAALCAMQKRNDPNSSDTEIFASVQQVHKYNLELLHKIDQLEVSRDEALTTGMRREVEEVEFKLADVTRELEALRNTHAQMSLIVEQVEKQRDSYKEELESYLNRSPVKPKSDLSASQNATENGENVKVYVERVADLKDMIASIVNDKQTSEKALHQRIDGQMELISQLRATNVNLTSDLNYQKRSGEVAVKRVRDAEKDAAAKAAAAAKAHAEADTARANVTKVTDELMRKVDEITRLQIDHNLVKQKFEVARDAEIRLSAEIEALRTELHNNERLNLSLECLQSFVSSSATAKNTQLQSQIDTLMVERDNYRNCLEDLRTSADRRCSEAQSSCVEATAEKERLAIDLRYQRESFELLQQRLTAAEAELAKATEATKSVSVNSESDIHQLRNSNAYLEKQNAEQKILLAGLKARLEAKERELSEISTVSGTFESTIRNQDEVSRIQTVRLESIVSELTAERDAAKTVIDDLNEKLNAAAERETNALNELENVRSALQVQIDNLVRTLTDVERERETAYQEASSRATEVATLRVERETVDVQLQGLQEQINDATTREAELRQNLKDAAEDAESKIAAVEVTLNRVRNAEVLQLKENARLSEEIKAFQARDKDLQTQCDALLDRLQNATADAIATTTQLDTSSGDVSLITANANDSSQILIGVLRNAKNREVELRMAAEHELSRIRAQTSIDENRITELTAEVENLKSQVEINAQLTAEKSSLLERLELLPSLQRQNVDLQNELATATTNADAACQSVKQLEDQINTLSTAKNLCEAKVSMLNDDLNHARSELNETRNRLLQAEKQNSLNKLQAVGTSSDDVENPSKKEFDDLSARHKDLNAKFTSVKKLAVRYRDEAKGFSDQIQQLNDLKTQNETLIQEIETLKSSQPPQRVAWNKHFNELNQCKKKLADVTKQLNDTNLSSATMKTQLEEKVKTLQVKANEADELSHRAKTVSNILQNTQKKNNELTKALEELKLKHDEQQKKIITLEKAVTNATAATPASEISLATPSVTPTVSIRKRPIPNQYVEQPKRPKITFGEPAKNDLPSVQNDQPVSVAEKPHVPPVVVVPVVVEQPNVVEGENQLQDADAEPIDVDVGVDEELPPPVSVEREDNGEEGDFVLLEGDEVQDESIHPQHDEEVQQEQEDIFFIGSSSQPQVQMPIPSVEQRPQLPAINFDTMEAENDSDGDEYEDGEGEEDEFEENGDLGFENDNEDAGGNNDDDDDEILILD